MKSGLRCWVLASLAVVGCDCTDEPAETCPEACASAGTSEAAGSLCCEETSACVDYDLASLCDDGFVCAGTEAVVLEAGCVPSCRTCEPGTGLARGLLATYLDAWVYADGSAVLSGYAPGVPAAAGQPYGDLVVGHLDPEDGSIDWDVVDGAPTEPVTHDRSGWRGGVQAPGDDVGRWTSLAEREDGTLYVAYYDRTHGALKLATRASGGWSVQTVDDLGDAGRYASLVIDREARATIAYLRISASDEDAASLISSVVVASASLTEGPVPGDWQYAVVASTPVACRAGLCREGEVCIENTGRCETVSADCEFPCDDNEACVLGSCEDVWPADYVEDLPPAVGLYDRLAETPDGLALIYYDRIGGNLWGAGFDGPAWNEPFLIDGYATLRPTAGDSGLACSLFVDGTGTWHVSYVDGTEEALRYARVVGETVTLRSTVDDGTEIDGARYPDGRHLVGDDSALIVTPTGEIRVGYQDATATRLLYATSGDGEAWTVRTVDSEDATGFWVNHDLLGDTSYLVTFWRNPVADTSGVRLFKVD